MVSRQIWLTDKGEQVAEAINAMETLGANRAETEDYIITGRRNENGLTEITVRAKISVTRQDKSGGSEQLLSD